MKAPLSYLPSLPALIGIVTGTIAYQCGAGVWLLALLAVAACTLYALKQHYIAFISLFAAIGILMSIAHKPTEVPEWIYDGEHTYTAEICRGGENGSVVSYVVEIIGIDGTGCYPIKAQLTVRSLYGAPEAGSTIDFHGRLEPVETRDCDVPHEIDYQRFLKSAGIRAYATVTNVNTIKEPSRADRIINRMRDGIYNSIVYSPIEASTASFILATAMGDDTYITTDKYDQYRAIGIAHILALSGLHVGILVSFVAFILFPLNALKRGRPLRSILTLLIIWAYTVIVGFTPSIVRAAVMITVFIGARHVQRGYSALNSLSLAVIAIVCINPTWLMAPGFQLSVAAVASILIFGGLIPKRLKRYPVLYYVLNLMVIPVAAMLGTGIVSAYYFNTFAGMFLIGNVITGLMFPWILIGGMILAVLTSCGITATALGTAVDWAYTLMDTLIDHIATIRGAEIKGIYFSAWVVLPYSLMLIALAYALRRNTMQLWLTTSILLFATVITQRLTAERLPAAELYVPRNKQATEVIVRTGDKAWLISYGKDPDARLQECNSRYRNFLMHRGCGDSFTPYGRAVDTAYRTADGNTHPLTIHDGYVRIGDTALLIIAGDSVSMPKGIRAKYAIVTPGYKGDIIPIYRELRPDTIVLGPGIYHKRRKALLSECADSIPCIDLRQRPIKIADR